MAAAGASGGAGGGAAAGVDGGAAFRVGDAIVDAGGDVHFVSRFAFSFARRTRLCSPRNLSFVLFSSHSRCAANSL